LQDQNHSASINPCSGFEKDSGKSLELQLVQELHYFLFGYSTLESSQLE